MGTWQMVNDFLANLILNNQFAFSSLTQLRGYKQQLHFISQRINTKLKIVKPNGKAVTSLIQQI
ncbi:hypothetical protein ASE74_12820 [Pedobacter sp. Leaf216]|nr:hypothetical protein ASE74_12820 [Pedobacter sp. Leaf216]